MSRTIHVNDSFFGHDAGRIENDGTIKLPDGIWGHQTVGYIEKDGIYIPDGLTRRKVIDISPQGHMYLMEDASLFHRGTWVGSIDPDGRVRDTDRRTVAELRKGLDEGSDTIDEIFGVDGGRDGKTGVGPGTRTSPGPGIVASLLMVSGVILIPLAIWAIISHTPALLTSESISAGGKMGVTVTLLLTAVAVAFVSLKSERGVFLTLRESLGAGTLAAILSFGAYVLIADPPTGLGDWLLFVLFTPFICFCWAAVTSVVVALPISGIKAAIKE